MGTEPGNEGILVMVLSVPETLDIELREEGGPGGRGHGEEGESLERRKRGLFMQLHGEKPESSRKLQKPKNPY